MKRFMTAFVAGIGMMLATTAGVATAGLMPLPPSHPAPTQQSNDSDQGQVQVIPIAPQLNVQNVNVLSGGVSQGNANNANTGQAAQQENGGQSAPVPTVRPRATAAPARLQVATRAIRGRFRSSRSLRR